MNNNAQVNFGYKRVSPEEKTRRVGEVFDSVAGQYDLMNDLMSAGIHRWWKNMAVQLSAVRPGQRVLDLAGGTGDMAMRFVPHLKAKDAFQTDGELVIGDINGAMLAHGQDRLLDKGFCQNIHWIQADAQQLPFADKSFDLISIAFGLRNVTDMPKALKEMHRVLKVGGRVLILEFSKPTNPAINYLYDRYSFSVLPWLGETVAGDADSYRYLSESIRTHPDQQSLLDLMTDAGFRDGDFNNLSGGIVAIHRGWRK
jgi:demethylmenaquinone methyltransferase/2-methoxy-6-polyprenyl-1,4-benzoquinol methylase